MEDFIPKALKSAKKLDSVLSNATDPTLKHQTTALIEKNCEELIAAIDAQLKKNEKLNSDINTAVKLRRILTYDVKSYFTRIDSFDYEDETIIRGVEFDNTSFENAQKFVQEWPERRKLIEAKISKLERNPLRQLLKSRIQHFQDRLKEGDKYYSAYTEVFREAEQMKQYDKREVELQLRAINKMIYGTINDTIEKNILKAIAVDPSIIAHDVFCGKEYRTTTSSIGSNENNRNLYKYFDSQEIYEKLSKILSAYNKNKIQNAGKNTNGNASKGPSNDPKGPSLE